MQQQYVLSQVTQQLSKFLFPSLVPTISQVFKEGKFI